MEKPRQTRRPRQISTLCLSLGALELLRIVASVVFGFVLASPIKGEVFPGPAIAIVFSLLLLAALIGVFLLRRWGIVLYVCTQLIVALLHLVTRPVPVFAAALALLLVGMLLAAVFPYRSEFE